MIGDFRFSRKRSPGLDAQYNMPEQIAANEDSSLQFIRQLYEDCVERYGEDHEETRLVLQYVARLEKARLAFAV
jgi:hypothetical protein